MSELADIISGEFEEALEVKNPKSLHRGIYLLLSATVRKEEHAGEHDGLKASLSELSSDVKLIAQRMEEGFKRMDERFEAVDKRFEDMNQRFESMDKRFEDMNLRFESMDKRFESMDKRFESVDKRFEDMNHRFESIDKRFNRQTALISLGFVATTTILTVLKVFG